LSDQLIPGNEPPELASTARFTESAGPAPLPAAPSRVLVQGAMREAQRIGRYAVLRQLGEGGMGVVLAAYDEELDRKAALKLLRDRPGGAGENAGEHASERRIRILREAQAMARVSHPNVVQVYEVGEFSQPGAPDSHIFIAMEYIDGETLHAWQNRPGRAWVEILRMYLQAGQGLLAAHQSGLVHRDFKPDNVLVGSDGRPRVADFGLARGGDGGAAEPLPQAAGVSEQSGLLVSPLTQAGAIMGTPMYMSPEQYRGRPAGPRSDQFSFCVALYEALYKTLPFEGATFEALGANVLAGRVRPRPAGSPVPRPLHAALLRGLAAASRR
jgi:serine/threonine-protein kinase